MELRIATSDPRQTDADFLLIGLAKDETPPTDLDEALDGLLTDAIQTREINPTGNEVAVLHPHGKLPYRRILVAPLGKQRTRDALRNAAALGVRKARALGGGVLATTLARDPLDDVGAEARAQAVAEGLVIGNWSFRELRKPAEDEGEISATLVLAREEESDAADRGVSVGLAIARGVNLARTLVDEPPNIATPGRLAQVAQDLDTACAHIVTRILDRDAAAELGMGAFLGVAMGSDTPPYFIILEHRLDEFPNVPPVVLVGKAVTFDTGGYNLKPGAGMADMKSDMAGGAAVLGVFTALAELEVPLPVVGLIPATENMVSGHSYRPSDVLTSLGGKTIEIGNTDAEGRLIMADALEYAKRYNPRYTIDIATLTGAKMIALGYDLNALFATDDDLAAAIEAAARDAGEPTWRMPLWDAYDAYLESKIADVKNVGIRAGGAITAALFLRRFVDGAYPWAHLDIAGSATVQGDRQPKPPLTPYGATGVPVRTLIYLLQREAARKE